MARLRRSKNDGSALLGLLIVVLLIGGIITFLARNPGVLVALLVLAGAIVTYKVGRRRQAAAQLAAYERQEYQLQLERSRAIAPYMAMSPREFEEALAFLCARDGCTGTQVTGGPGDMGADVIATTPEGWRLVIQAKRYSPTNLVAGPDLQKFGGTAFAVHGADVAAVVTTSAFTRQATDYAGRMNIHLYDQAALVGWASRRGAAPWHQPGRAQIWPALPEGSAPAPLPPALAPVVASGLAPVLPAAAPESAGMPRRESAWPESPGWTPAPPTAAQ